MIRLAYALIAAGLVDSAYLLYISTQPDCPIGTCAPISVFSLPHYLPALLGLLWFAFSALVFKIKLNRKIVILWRFSGVAGAAFLGTYAILNSYYCPFCFAAYGIGIGLVAISEKIHG
ncbi:MAG: hypothetical protein XD40_0544 [Archaeoglobus fulgidus]|uniref:Vitamin K epoxide reductase domain-containing protein n=1 Tax=Archaeoglobus fulgidus TaxID=2234 RepID=A0A101DEY6_ARCFL|nr:hypothetical protein [Archaeoglobus fulgidus]KUJ94300.1 MAG: hypothetical protein XD40_0544 [Archaeoglobus fulgidus]KUK07575.1 MAG: Uncharacterized protein XD48_0229 [Archaeoglobus fulgidus]